LKETAFGTSRAHHRGLFCSYNQRKTVSKVERNTFGRAIEFKWRNAQQKRFVNTADGTESPRRLDPGTKAVIRSDEARHFPERSDLRFGSPLPGAAHGFCFLENIDFPVRSKIAYDFASRSPLSYSTLRVFWSGDLILGDAGLCARKQVLAGWNGHHNANGVGSAVANSSRREQDVE